MYPDITRDTFRPARHFVGLVMQQGRVQLDADINEQADIDRYRRRELGDGVIGPMGVEKDSGAFAISVTPDGADLFIAPGRLWIDGRLCENTPQAVAAEVTAASEVRVSGIDLDGHELAVDEWIEVITDAATIGPLRVASVAAAAGTVGLSDPLISSSVGDSIMVRRLPTLNAQPYSRDRVDLAELADGQYAVTLTAWDHEVTEIDDEAIPEVALNGTDTATRMQSAWRVELARVGNAGSGNCSTSIPNFPPTEPDGRLIAFVDAATAADNPCILPDAGGYRGLEHQLYRVEVHRVIGGEVVLKWQRDNASHASRVDAVGTTFRVEDVGRDDVVGFQEVGFVELTDQRLALGNRSGDLLRISTINRATREIEIDTTFAELHAETSVQRASDDFRPRARRWDGRAVAILGGAEQDLPLERGLVVRLTGTEFNEGDYWLIPARTATQADPSRIEWPIADDGTALAVAPHGVDHSYGRLAMVDVAAVGAVAESTLDCRPRFPWLTDIEATDVGFDPEPCGFPETVTNVQDAIDELCGRSGGTCTRTAVPGEGWESVFDDLPDGASAEICLPVGGFPLSDVIEVTGSGHLVVHGGGWGSVVTAGQSDSAIVFVGWQSVTVRDLSVTTGSRGTRPRPNPDNGLRGALSFRECGDTTVERVRVQTLARTQRATSALSVYGATGETLGQNRARIAHCVFEVGDRQVGLLAVDVGRLVVDDNVLNVVPLPRQIGGLRDLTAGERGSIGTLLFNNLAVAEPVLPDPPAPRRPGGPGAVTLGSLVPDQPPAERVIATRRAALAARAVDNQTVQIAGQAFSFSTIPEATGFWAEAIDNRQFTSMAEFQKFQDRTVREVVGGAATTSAAAALELFLTNRVATRRIATMSQGIVAGGSALGDVTITNNHVGPSIRGIHVGVSHQAARTAAPDVGDRIVVADNRVSVQIPSEGARGRHGIFCGNAGSVTVRGNEVTFATAAPSENIRSTGVRVFGFVDRMINVRENQIEGFVTSVEVTPLQRRGTGQLTRTRLYQVRENVLSQSGVAVRVDGPFASQIIIENNAGTP